MAAALLTRKLDFGLPPGARTAAGSLALDDFAQAFAAFAIHTATEEAAPVPLYARMMGERFDRLPAAVRDAHLVNGELRLDGEARIDRGRSPLAQLLARLVRLPPAGENIPLSVWMEERNGGETWRRHFGDHGFATRLHERGGLLVERIGLLRFGMNLRSEPDGLSMPLVRWWLGPLPMPRALAPRTVAHEREIGGRFHFDVSIALPLIGPLIRYRGWLMRQPAAKSAQAGRIDGTSGSLR